MKYNFEEVIDRHGTNSMKCDLTEEMTREWGNTAPWPEKPIIYVSTADMDFRCPPCVKDALQKVVDYNLYGYYYLDPRMSDDYHKSLISWNKRRYGWEFKPEDIIYTDGTINAVKMAVEALTDKDDSVMID